MVGVISVSKKISQVLVWLGGSLILASALLVTAEVMMRKVLNISLAGADELSGYAFAIATSLGFAYVLFERAHIRVDVLYVYLPAKMQLLLNLIGLIALTGFAALITVMVWQLVADTISNGSHSITPLRTPLTLVQLPWLIGWIFFLWSGVVLMVNSIVALLRGDWQEVRRHIGVKSIDEHIESETVSS